MGKVFSLRWIIAADILFTSQPFKITGCDKKIGSMGATGNLSTTGAMAILEDTDIGRYFVADFVAKTTTAYPVI